MINGNRDELMMKQFKLITRAIIDEDKEAEAELFLNEKLISRRAKLQSIDTEVSNESSSTGHTK